MSAISGNKLASIRSGIARLLVGIPFWLLIPFLLLLGGIWTGICFHLQAAYDRIEQNALRDSANLSRVFAEQVRTSVREIDLSLLTLRDEWRSDPQRFHEAVVRQQHFTEKFVFQTGIVNADGNMVYSSFAPLNAPIPLADRQYFRIHRERRSDQLFISEPLLEAVSNRWSVQFARPILDENKGFLGVIFMSITPAYFVRFQDEVKLGNDSQISLFRADSALLAHAPNPEQRLEKSLTGLPFPAKDAPETGHIRARSESDSIERYTTWHVLKDYGLVVMIEESVETLLTPYYLQRKAFLFGGALGSCLLVLLAGLILFGLRKRTAFEFGDERWKLALESTGDAVWQWDIATDELRVSPRLYTITGMSEQEIGRSFGGWRRRIHPEDLLQVLADIQACLEGRSPALLTEYRVVCGDGSVKWLLARGMLIRHKNREMGDCMIGTQSDITGRKLAEAQVRMAAAVFDSREGMLVTDARCAILRVNRAFEDVTGYRAEEVIGKTPAILQSGRHDKDFYKRMWDAIVRHGHWEGEIWNRKKSGEIYVEWVVITAVRDGRGRITHYASVFSDITIRKNAEAQIRNLAFYDPLTGLPNRRLLADHAAHALAASARSCRYGALMLLDLDHFKRLNDTLGHDVGDDLLIQVARRLSAAVRGCDTVARLGGDEFVVMAREFSEDRAATVTQAEVFAEKILATLNQPYTLKGLDTGSYHNTPSIGISLFRGHEQPFDVLLKQADIALYQAKDAGRSTFSLYNAEMETAQNEKNQMQTRLRQALAHSDFRLYFQPKVDSAHRIIGAEALLRWHPPGKAVAMPSSFLAVAEKTGLILPIGKWALESACAMLAAWAASPETDKLEISLNISARQFHQPGFVATVCSALATTGANPAFLKLELTETIAFQDIEDTIRKMRELRDLGVTFALDDFGTGYSSLSCLKRLPVSQVKIDRSFVHDMASDPCNAAIIQTIIGMSHSLGLQAIAEGVETVEQLAFLQKNDCCLFQGDLFGCPMPAAQFEELLATHNATHC